MHRVFFSIVTGTLVAGLAFLPAHAFADGTATESAPALHTQSRVPDAYSSLDSAPSGSRPRAATLRERIDLPFGLNYSRDAKSLVMPFDEKNEWGVGLNLNLNATAAADLSPPGFHFTPKRTPGLILQKRF